MILVFMSSTLKMCAPICDAPSGIHISLKSCMKFMKNHCMLAPTVSRNFAQLLIFIVVLIV